MWCCPMQSTTGRGLWPPALTVHVLLQCYTTQYYQTISLTASLQSIGSIPLHGSCPQDILQGSTYPQYSTLPLSTTTPLTTYYQHYYGLKGLYYYQYSYYQDQRVYYSLSYYVLARGIDSPEVLDTIILRQSTDHLDTGILGMSIYSIVEMQYYYIVLYALHSYVLLLQQGLQPLQREYIDTLLLQGTTYLRRTYQVLRRYYIPMRSGITS